MANLQISLLGPWQVRLAGRLVTHFPTTKVQALLAYLAVEAHKPHTRDALIGLFWADYRTDSARQNLRKTLYRLRQLFPLDYLLISNQTIQFDPASAYSLDVTQFVRLLVATHHHPHANRLTCHICNTQLHQAVDLYRGDFLEHFFVEGSPAFEEWVLSKREWLRREVLRALHQLAAAAEAQGSYDQAYTYAWRQVELDPVNEEAHQQIMRALALSGRRSEALAQYASCRRILATTLAAEPTPTTVALAEQIRAGKLAVQAQPLLYIAQHTTENVSSPFAVKPPLANALHSHLSGTLTSSNQPEEHPKNQSKQQGLAERRSVEQPLLFIGRQAEMAQLHAIWTTVQQGRARFVVIAGEAGIGKTLLAEWWREEIRHQGAAIAQAFCYVADRKNKYWPVKMWLAQTPLQTIQASLDGVERAVIERVKSTLPGEDADEEVQGANIEYHFVESLTRIFLKVKQPLALFIDDIHRCDFKSLRFLQRLLLDIRDVQAQILVVGTMHAKQVNEELDGLLTVLTASQQLQELLLQPFDEAETKALAERICGHTLPTGEIAKIVETSGGLPFYIPLAIQYDGEELLSSKDLRLILRNFRDTSQQAQELAQLAATYARPFGIEFMEIVTGWGDTKVVAAVEELWKQDIVRFHDDYGKAGNLPAAKWDGRLKQIQSAPYYIFRHDLLRKATYENMSWFDKRRRHLQVATALEIFYTKNLYLGIAQIAVHYELAGKSLPASTTVVKAYLDKSRLDCKTFDYESVIKSCETGLALLPRITDTLEDEKRELEVILQHTLGTAELIRTGNAGEKVLPAYKRILDLYQKHSEIPLPQGIIWGGGSNLMIRGELKAALIWGKRCWELTQALPNSWHYLDTLCVLGVTEYYRGNFKEAIEHLRNGSQLYDAIQSKLEPANYGQNTGIICKSYQGLCHWFLGYPDKAVQVIDMALRLTFAQDDEPTSNCLAHYAATWIHQLRREWQQTQTQAKQFIQVATDKYHIELFQLIGQSFALQAQFELTVPSQASNPEELVIGMVHCHEDYKKIGASAGLTISCNMVAHVSIKMRQLAYAQQLLEEGINIAQITDEGFLAAELYRLQGEVEKSLADVEPMNAADHYAAAERFFEKACSIAQKQGAKSLELRATTSLCHLWHEQHKHTAAHQQLANLYSWFIEGFATLDLQEASTLLAQLLYHSHAS